MRGFSRGFKHYPTKMSISVDGRVAKWLTNAIATQAVTVD
jgi:hypothetical protein